MLSFVIDQQFWGAHVASAATVRTQAGAIAPHVCSYFCRGTLVVRRAATLYIAYSTYTLPDMLSLSTAKFTSVV